MNKYHLEVAKSLTTKGKEFTSHQIFKDGLPIYPINKFLKVCSNNAESTARQYGYGIIKLLTFLHDVKHKNVSQAIFKDITDFMDYQLMNQDNIFYLSEFNLTYSSINSLLSAIKSMYKYLILHTDIHISMDYMITKDQYVTGDLWDLSSKSYVSKRGERTKDPVEYINWYTEEQIQLIIDGFKTHRDKAIFLLTLEGRRIDEVLSMRYEDINPLNQTIVVNKSKGKTTGKTDLTCYMKPITLEVLENYLFSERTNILMSLPKDAPYPTRVFLNLRKDKHFGQPVKYDNYLMILKNTAKRVGLDPKKIRTHSGRKSFVMDFLIIQIEQPELNITDEMIRNSLGWRSPSSIDAYRDTNNRKVAKLTMDKLQKQEKGHEYDQQKSKH